MRVSIFSVPCACCDAVGTLGSSVSPTTKYAEQLFVRSYQQIMQQLRRDKGGNIPRNISGISVNRQATEQQFSATHTPTT